jgi:hypothetical protein
VARIRTIKPEFFTSEPVVNCSHSARLLFIGMWVFADDRGVLPASAGSLKMKVFPGDNWQAGDVERWIVELENNGLISRFDAEGTTYFHIRGFAEHQVVSRPTYKYPQPKFTEDSRRTHVGLMEDSRSATPRKGREEERKGTEKAHSEARACEASPVPDTSTPQAESERNTGETKPAQAESKATPLPEAQKPAIKPLQSVSGPFGPQPSHSLAADTSPSDLLQPEFVEFWEAYPAARRINQQAAWRAWQRVNRDMSQTTAILEALPRWVACDQWQDEGGRYAVSPERFLLDKLYMRDPPPPRPAPSRRSGGRDTSRDPQRDREAEEMLGRKYGC